MRVHDNSVGLVGTLVVFSWSAINVQHNMFVLICIRLEYARTG